MTTTMLMVRKSRSVVSTTSTITATSSRRAETRMTTTTRMMRSSSRSASAIRRRPGGFFGGWGSVDTTTERGVVMMGSVDPMILVHRRRGRTFSSHWWTSSLFLQGQQHRQRGTSVQHADSAIGGDHGGCTTGSFGLFRDYHTSYYRPDYSHLLAGVVGGWYRHGIMTTAQGQQQLRQGAARRGVAGTTFHRFEGRGFNIRRCLSSSSSPSASNAAAVAAAGDGAASDAEGDNVLDGDEASISSSDSSPPPSRLAIVGEDGELLTDAQVEELLKSLNDELLGPDGEEAPMTAEDVRTWALHHRELEEGEEEGGNEVDEEQEFLTDTNDEEVEEAGQARLVAEDYEDDDTDVDEEDDIVTGDDEEYDEGVATTTHDIEYNYSCRLSRLVSSSMSTSRRRAERFIQYGEVTVAGKVVKESHVSIPLRIVEGATKGIGSGIISVGTPVKVSGTLLSFDRINSAPLIANLLAGQQPNKNDRKTKKDGKQQNDGAAVVGQKGLTRVWLIHKLPGELVTERDPLGRPSMMDRLRRGGVGKSRTRKSQSNSRQSHLIPIGRLDMQTEGLILVTNDGRYAQIMERPQHKFHRIYRARVHGKLTPSKLSALRNGCVIKGVRYRGMKVQLERVGGSNAGSGVGSGGGKGGTMKRGTNTWLRLTCQEGKNRQIRKVMEHLGLRVTRLIRISFGDYRLETIPPGMAIEVPFKQLIDQKKKGDLQYKQEQDPSSKKGAGGAGAGPSKSKAGPSAGEEPKAEPVRWIRTL